MFSESKSLMMKFKDTFLIESPFNSGKNVMNDMIDSLRMLIDEYIQVRYKVIQLNQNTFKMNVTGTELIYYWNTNNADEIILAAQIAKRDLAAAVTSLGKDVRYAHKDPKAKELYKIIVKDLSTSLKLMSDGDMTEDAFNNWVKLLNDGYKISVYDKNMPGMSFTNLYTREDMLPYFKDDETYHRFQFILSESQEQLGQVMAGFSIYRVREHAGRTNRDS